ncbi:hypothetical protein [Sandarakinorhabdus sp. DWP1-3-1]|uniref:hypothetical protein n=1 Tax=Sandarakinorhabdus sp. DWP1-3-1 TaxID=2804627 RepID=UPI003CF26DC0
MAKFASNDVLDGSLNIVRAATRMVAVSGQPASYAAADSGRLAEAPLTTGDFTLAPGDISGRKVGIAPKSGLAVIAAGTADHVALLDAATARLLYVTTCPAQALAPGGTVNIAAWSVEIGAPA